MSTYSDLAKTAEALCDRLLNWKDTSQAAQARGEVDLEFAVSVLWEAEDEAAVAAYAQAKQALLEELLARTPEVQP